MIHSAREKVSPLMCSHVPPMKEKELFSLSCMEVYSIRHSIRGAAAVLSQWSAGTQAEGSVH